MSKKMLMLDHLLYGHVRLHSITEQCNGPRGLCKDYNSDMNHMMYEVTTVV